MKLRIILAFLAASLFSISAADNSSAQNKNELLLTFPGQWQFSLPEQYIILTSDQQLLDLQDPDKKINMSLGLEKNYKSLREIREAARQVGCRTVKLAFDNFFRQYRKDSGDERKLLPDSDEYIQRIQKISRFLEEYNLGLELSLLSPLELGPAFKGYGGESGRWIQYKTDIRDPQTGKFSLMFWEQIAWSNNKGKFNLKRSGIRAFAYKQKQIAGGSFSAVNPDDILEITSGIRVEEWPGTESPETAGFRSRRIRVYHQGETNLKGYDRVFVLLSYTTPEMDYFSPQALPFLKQLLQKYHDAGIILDGLYSDEMHIQQDWHYFGHHDNGQFNWRYLTENMAKEYANRYGSEYINMDKYMLYFVFGPQIYLNNTRACRNSQVVMGELPADIQRTFLFRDRYYKLLNNRVVDLFVSAKQFAEKLYGKDLLTRAHATWAQSPTIDQWDVGDLNTNCYKYEYTPNFVWSNTVQQAASACYDYFKWGEYLTGNGTDHPEGGWSDRNYYGSALACSFGILNKYPNSYTGFWGMPAAVSERIQAVVSAFGANATSTIKAITGNVHRDVDVLMLYPMSLVAFEERFGSWMVQYGYANYITAEKLLEMGRVQEDGKIHLAGRTFTTLIALFEILPQPGLLEMMQSLALNGGNVIWSGPPPIIDAAGADCRTEWQTLFGVNYQPAVFQGEIAAGKVITFQNSFSPIPPQTILTDFIVDRVYPAEGRAGSEIIAKVEQQVVGTRFKYNQGSAFYLGFRPRDDQSASLGMEQRTWFEVLNCLGAYMPTGRFNDVNDNTEYLSRTTDYLCTRFPNGATVIARHYRTHRESWPGGFSRNKTQDEEIIRQNPLPADSINLKDFKVNGHKLAYDGRLILAFNSDQSGHLIAFEGHDCNCLQLDDKTYIFSKEKQKHLAWAAVAADRQIPNKAFFQIYIDGSGEISIPLATERKNLKLCSEGPVPGSMGENVDFVYENGFIKFQATEKNMRRPLYILGAN
jgi:hypothetical protein